MKRLVSLFATIFALLAVACGNDEVDKPAPKPGPQEPAAPFVVDITATTRGSVTFSVTPSNPTVDYICEVYEKEIIDDYRRDDFIIKNILSEFTLEASDKGMTLDEYLPEITYYDYRDLKFSGLAMNTEFYIVIFGVKSTAEGCVGTTEVVKVPFKTLDVEMSDATFEVTPSVLYNTVEFTVIPEDKEMLWYLCTVTKDYYNLNVGTEPGQKSEGEFYKHYFQNEINSLLAAGNSPEVVVNALIHSGDLRVGGSGLFANTEYYYLVAGMVMDEEGIVIVTDITSGTYTTGDPAPSGLYFDIDIYDVQQMSVAFAVKPSQKDKKYVCQVQPYDGVSTAEEIMTAMVDHWGPGWMTQQADAIGDLDFVSRPKSLPAAGRAYCIIAFGYEGGVISEPDMVTFVTPEGGSVEDLELTAKASSITPYGFTLTVTASDPTIYYAVGVCLKEDYDEEAFIADVNNEVDYYYTETTVKFNPRTIMAEILDQYYFNDMQIFNLANLQPNTEYMAYAYALDINTGHVVKTFTFDAIARTGTVGTVHPEIELVGYYSGDEEAGDVFDAPEVTKGKAIAVVTYKNFDNAASLHTIQITSAEGEDFTNIEKFPDAELWRITAGLKDWQVCPMDKPYSFAVVEWNKEVFALAYALDQSGMSGRMARLSLVPRADKKGDIKDLSDLYFSLYPKETRTSLPASLVVPEAVKIEAL
jgi:hypothetical protein